MSDYGKNFGFRRSEPSYREGRLRVPATGDFYQGDLVTYDPANEGFLKHAADGAAVVGGFTGLLIQEEGWTGSVFEAPVQDTHSKGKALNGKQAVFMTGAGLKIWLRNTAAETRFDGRAIAARSVLTMTSVDAIGDELQWNGTKWVIKAAGAGALRVTIVGTDYVEAVLAG